MTYLATSSSELLIPQSLTPKATIILYTSSDVLRADIFLAMKCVSSHYSQTSMDEFLDLMRTMFPDSEITWYFVLGCTKVRYVIDCGLKRSYQNKFMSAENRVIELLDNMLGLLLWVMTTLSVKSQICQVSKKP